MGHLRPTLAFCHRGSGNSTGPLSAVLQAACFLQLSASVRNSCYVPSATRELCILHKAIVATGPLAHELRWTKLCSLDLRWATGPNLAQLELIVTDLIPPPKGPCQGVLDLWPHLCTQPLNLCCSWPLPINSVDPQGLGAPLILKDYMLASRLWNPPGLWLGRPGKSEVAVS